MGNDPIVDEVRRARLEIERACDEDFAQIYARALEVQKSAGAKLVSRSSAANVPIDGSINLDHYLYGAPKQQP